MEGFSLTPGDVRSRTVRYGFAVLAASAAITLRQVLGPIVGNTLPFATLYGALAFVVWFGGWRPAVLTAVLGYLAANYLFVLPRGAFVLTPAMWVGMAVYGVSCFLIIFLGEAARRSYERLHQQVAERTRAEEALRLRTAQFETLLNAAPSGVYLVDNQFRIRHVNPAALSVFGDIPDLLGRYFDEVMHKLWPKAYADEIVGRFRHTLETGEPYIVPEHAEERLDRGVREYYEWQIHRIPLPDGEHGVVCYFRDISAQVNAREQLRNALAKAEEGDRLLAALMEHVPEGITIADAPDVRIRMVSRAGRELTGRAPELIEGIPVEQHAENWGLYYGDGVTPARNEDLPLTRAVQKGETVIGEEWVLRRSDGRRVPVLCNAAPIRDASGKVVSGIIAWRDISDRKETEERFHLAVEAAPNGMALTNEAGVILLVNSFTEKLFGYRRDEMVGKPVEMLLPEGLRAAHGGHRRAFHAEPQTRPMGAGRELYGLHKNGTEFPIEIGLNPIKTDHTTLVLAAIVDITARKEAEAASRLLQSVVQSSLDGIISTDLTGKITSWNSGAEHIFDYSANEMVGRTISVIVPPGHEDELPAILTRVGNGEAIEQHDTVRRTKTGKVISISATWSPIHDGGGRITGASKIVRDITERKIMEQQRVELLAKERALASEKALREREAEFAYYEGLLTTRNTLLEKSGYAVSSALGNEEARAAGQDLLAKTDLVLIGSSGTGQQRTAMIDWVKEHRAKVPVLALQSHLTESLSGADAVAVADHPETWLPVVASMIRSGKRVGGHR